MVANVRFSNEGKLTGRRRYRVGLFKRVILQVEVELIHICGFKVLEESGVRWRDAKPHEVGLPNKLYTHPTFLSINDSGGVVEKQCSDFK